MWGHHLADDGLQGPLKVPVTLWGVKYGGRGSGDRLVNLLLSLLPQPLSWTSPAGPFWPGRAPKASNPLAPSPATWPAPRPCIRLQTRPA